MCGFTMSYAQVRDTIRAKTELEEVVVSGSKFLEKSSKLAVSIKSIGLKEFKRLNLSNTGNMLESSGLAFVQKSQQGGGSPIIRGFEANKILLVVDGIRMNNAIFRGGHLQNIITIDPNALQRVEVVYGPSSTLYGSDALGGVINMFTKEPALAAAGKKDSIKTVAQIRYSSAVSEKTAHVDFNYGGQKFASFTSVTYSDFGDLITGKNRDKKYPDFGKSLYHVERINGKDSAVKNQSPERLRGSGYSQFDLLQKFLYKPNANTEHLLNIQFSNSSNIPRYDRLSEIANGLPRFSEWYYGPQKRFAAAYTLNKTYANKFFTESRKYISYQAIEESRFDRRFKQSVRNERMEKIEVISLGAEARKILKKHEFVVGGDAQLNYLQSTARGFNVDNGAITKITTRYPDGKNNMSYAALFAQHIWKITNRLTLNDGIRLNYVSLNSNFSDTTLLHLPYTRAKQNNVAASGNIGLAYSPNNQFKTAVVISSGFRAPNIDDLAKVFDSKAGSVIVPNTGLKPEHTQNVEWNIIKYFTIKGNPGGAKIGGSIYYTWFKNAIITDKFTLNGNDSIFYNGVKSQVLANQNKASATIWGWNLYGSLILARNLELQANSTYTYGRYTSDNAKVPLDHVPPFFGRGGVKYENKKWYAEAYVMFNSWKRIKNYNPFGEDNQQYATVDGMPSWHTYNVRCNYDVAKTFQLQFAVENIADKHYRAFASGISGPGRNFVLSAKLSL